MVVGHSLQLTRSEATEKKFSKVSNSQKNCNFIGIYIEGYNLDIGVF